jgi:hypothetical protein
MDSSIPAEYQTDEGLRTLANFLRQNVKVRSAVEHEKRVDYFKGMQKSFLLFAEILFLTALFVVTPVPF